MWRWLIDMSFFIYKLQQETSGGRKRKASDCYCIADRLRWKHYTLIFTCLFCCYHGFIKSVMNIAVNSLGDDEYVVFNDIMRILIKYRNIA